MQVNPREIADLVTFTEEILNRKLHFLCTTINKTLLYTPQVLDIGIFLENVTAISNDVLSEAIQHKGSSNQRGYYVTHCFSGSGSANT